MNYTLLPQLAAKIRLLPGAVLPPGTTVLDYHRMWKKAVSGEIRCIRVGSRLAVEDQDLMAAAIALGVQFPEPKPARARRAPSSNSGAAVAA